MILHCVANRVGARIRGLSPIQRTDPHSAGGGSNRDYSAFCKGKTTLRGQAV